MSLPIPGWVGIIAFARDTANRCVEETPSQESEDTRERYTNEGTSRTTWCGRQACPPERRLNRHERWYDRAVELDKNFKDCLAGLVGAGARKDVEDVHECTAYIAKRLEGHGMQDFADSLRWIVLMSGSLDGVWTLGQWEDDLYNLDDVDRLYSVYGTARLAESRDLRKPPAVLTPEQLAMVKEILAVARSRLQHSEPLPTCLFTYGTAIQEPFDLALHIARELGIECSLVEFTEEIEKRSRRWSGQLFHLCEFAAASPRVLVLRKVERICNSVFVNDGWRVEQLKCVRERFLDDLLKLEAPTVVVACTNLEMDLDAGDWERFGYRMELNAAEPDPGLMAFRSVGLGDGEGLQKALAAFSAKD